MSLEAYLYGNAGEDIYGVQNVDMNPFQQADNFDDIGSGSNSLLDVQDSCMNENEMENLINRQPYTSIKNEPMNFDNNIQNHNIQNHKEMKMNSREDYMYDDIDSDDDDGFNDENAEHHKCPPQHFHTNRLQVTFLNLFVSILKKKEHINTS
jgi:hypothetical protein